jgi:hypothetical protein
MLAQMDLTFIHYRTLFGAASSNLPELHKPLPELLPVKGC